MRFRRDDGDGGFGMGGMGGSFGASGYDPHTPWDGSTASRGVMRDDSRVPRQHPDEQQAAAQLGGRGYREYGQPPQRIHPEHSGFSNYAGGGNRDRASYGSNPGPGPRDHLSEQAARQQWNESHHFNGPVQQAGYGQSQFPYEDGNDRGPHYGKGPKGYKRSDDRIREEVCELMSRQGYIDASDVEVTVESSVVRLVGTVASRQDKRALELIADRVHGVEEVRNELRLRKADTAALPPRQPTAQQPSRDPVSQSAATENGRNQHS